MGVGGLQSLRGAGVPYPPQGQGQVTTTPMVVPMPGGISPHNLWGLRPMSVSVCVSSNHLSLIYQRYSHQKQGIPYPPMRLAPAWRHAIRSASPG